MAIPPSPLSSLKTAWFGPDGREVDATPAVIGPRGPQGEQGVQGVQGETGATGEPGASAYEVAVANGFEGTELEWLASLAAESAAAEQAALDAQLAAQAAQDAAQGAQDAALAAESAAGIAATDAAAQAAAGVVDDLAVHVAQSEAARDLAVSAAASVAPNWFGSVLFPRDNGDSTDPLDNGQITLTGSRTALVGTAGTAAALWGSAQSILVFCALDFDRLDGLNRLPVIFSSVANAGTLTAARAIALRYFPAAYTTSGQRRKVQLYLRGESAASSAWLIEVVVPATVRSTDAILAWNDGSNGYLSVRDAATGTWHDSAAVAKPAGWAGVGTNALTNDIAIGGSGADSFPKDNSGSRQTTPQLRGAVSDLIFADVAMTKANALSILGGASPETVLGAGNVRLHAPLVANGALSTALPAYNSRSGVTVTMLGTLLSGPTLKAQGAANFITIDRLPPIFAVSRKASAAWVQLTGTHGGTAATGTAQVRVVGRSGRIWRDWTNAPHTAPSAGRWRIEGGVIPGPLPEEVEVQVRFTGAAGLVATTGLRHRVQRVVVGWAQSEGAYATYLANTTRMSSALTTLNFSLRPGAAAVSYGARSFYNDYMVLQHGRLPGTLGDEAVNIANIVAQRVPEGAHIVLQMISGTSLVDVMDDAQSERTWEDVLARMAGIANRGPSGEYPVAGHFIVGWEAYSGLGAEIIDLEYRPFLSGRATSAVSAAQINRWLFDGTFSDDAEVVILPPARFSTGLTGAADSNSNAEADQRDAFRNYAHVLGYRVGPEQTTHKMQGENAAGALPNGTVHHPEPDDWEGSIEMSTGVAEAILMCLGAGEYPGPVFFEAIAAGSAANRVIVTAGRPRPWPGVGLANLNAGYSVAANNTGANGAVRLRTKKAGGNAGAGFEARRKPAGGAWGAWSKLNITDGVIQGDRVELTTVWTLAAGDEVEVRYHPGGPGIYSTATITQEAWRSGAIFFTGPSWTSGRPDLLGFAVAGSNQALGLVV